MKSRTGIKLSIALTMVCGLLMASTAIASNLAPKASVSPAKKNTSSTARDHQPDARRDSTPVIPQVYPCG